MNEPKKEKEMRGRRQREKGKYVVQKGGGEVRGNKRKRNNLEKGRGSEGRTKTKDRERKEVRNTTFLIFIYKS